ncbi:MAG: lipoyl synthase [Phycisphaerales bacterium]|nr:lipoyl synthase [Phycisphaerales bacterium]
MSVPANQQSPTIERSAQQRTLTRHPRPLGGDPTRSAQRDSVVSLTDMILDNADGSSHAAVRRKPAWLKVRAPLGQGCLQLKCIVDEHDLHTVCQEASCPNMGECWARGVATIMILGDICTRSCGFCNIRTGKPAPVDTDEPRRVAESVRLMGLRHIVLTSVDRDELPDGGAAIWAETIARIHEHCPHTSVEVLTPDFAGSRHALQTVIDAKPEILAHNIETVARMYPTVRPQADYRRSIEFLHRVHDAGLVTKTGIMVGIGERDDEVLQLMDDVQAAAPVPIITIGQYLQPTRNHLPIARWVTPDTFDWYHREGLSRGFQVVESGPLVRSSYHADEQADKLSPQRREGA